MCMWERESGWFEMDSKVFFNFVLLSTAAGYWLLITCPFVTTADPSEEGPKCKTLYTFGYGYRQFFHLPRSSIQRANGDMLSMKFKVKARSDAHVLLSPTPSPEEADAVYEIVLGAGKNTFSDIRRRRRANTKSSAYTKDILSGTELKEFWVKINHEGVLQVGNEGEDLPFMQWQDPEPMLIEYFSFCTWSGVAGKWLYDCTTADNENGSVAVPPVLTATDRLREALLTNYDIYSRPVANSSQPMEVNIQIEVNHVDFEATKSVMSVECVFTLIWQDEKMVWDPEHFNNLSMLSLVKHEIWQPQLIHFNAAGRAVRPLGQGSMQVTADGKVRWRSHSVLQSRCQPDLRQWPWDTQTCSMQLGSWSQLDILQFILYENSTKLGEQRKSSEWEIKRLEAESVMVKLPWLLDPSAYSSDDSDVTDEESPSAITFKFTIKRANTGYFYLLVLPLLVLMTMSLTCFWMDPLGREKLATNCLLVLLLCGWLLRLQSCLPAPAHNTPYLFRAYSWVLGVEGCVTVVSVYITSLVHTSHLRPPPRFICQFLSSSFMSSLFCLPKPELKRQDYGQLTERPGPDSSSLVDGEGWVDPHHGSWVLLAVFCDRLAFIAALIVYSAVLIN